MVTAVAAVAAIAARAGAAGSGASGPAAAAALAQGPQQRPFVGPAAAALWGLRRHNFRRGAAAVAAVQAKVKPPTLGPVVLEGTDLYGSHDDIRTLFRIRKLELRRGQKLAVVGSNGCGKSTLLAGLAGRQALAGGEVRLLPGAQVALVEQTTHYDPEKTVIEVILEGAVSPQAAAARRFRKASQGGTSGEDLQAALEGMDSTGAWDWQAHAMRVIDEVGLGHLKERQMSMLSGGEERRVALACALVDVQQMDLLVLDEPTNHLSAEGCDWLQETLQGLTSVSLVLVTHDRYFLDEVCDEILEIDGLGEAFMHPGGWNSFLTRRAERFQKRANLVSDAKVQLKRAQEWLDRGPRGRGTKNKAQIAGYYETKQSAEEVIGDDGGAPELGGKWVKTAKIGGGGKRTAGSSNNLGKMALRNATVLRPDGVAILDEVSFDFVRGCKVGIVGPNGAGKSTLLRALAGQQPLNSGEWVVGDGVRLGFLTQEASQWADPQQKVFGFVGEMADEVMSAEDNLFPEAKGMTRERQTAQLLKSVNFAEERWQTQLGMLSGGESRRLQLLRVLAQRPNVLLLDEPTNDLDAVTVDALERLLQPWPGTVILVSHDRSLLDGVCEAHVVFPKGGGQPRMWYGSHESLREQERLQEARGKAATAGAGVQPVDAAAHGEPVRAAMSPKERKKVELNFNKVEKNIEEAEAQLESWRAEMESKGDDAKRVMELYNDIEALEVTKAQLYEEWEALATTLQA